MSGDQPDSGGRASASAVADGARLSARQLLLLFLVAVLFFTAVRWDSSGWLQQQLLPYLDGYGVHATSLARDGGSLTLRQVRIDGVEIAGSPLLWERIVITPHWAALLQLQRVAHLSMQGRQVALDADLEQVDGAWLAVRNLRLSLPIALLAPLLPAMPVTLTGDLQCRGRVQVSRDLWRVEQPDIICGWQQATASMGGKPLALGSYRLQLEVADSDAGEWHWQLSGGDVAKVKGGGGVHPLADVSMSRWAVDGAVTITAGSGPLGAVIGAALGGGAHRVGGTLAAPTLD
ncbi:MAG: hypothetical protein Q9M13_08505 [Mariprofundales bacterium]|nr:hypothetical protein [Mariprofundales bacterium]